MEIEGPTIASLFIGLLMVQILLSAVWTAMAPFSLLFRFGTGTLAALFLLVCFYRVAYRDGGGHAVAISICLPILVQWFLLQVPLWYARYRGWRIGTASSELQANERTEFQFGIKQLLVWTTVIAISIAFIKAGVAGIELDPATGMMPGMIEVGLYLTVGNSLIALPIIWSAFVHRRAWIWHLISIVICIAVCLVEVVFMNGPGMDEEFMLVINITQTLLAMIAMALVRQLGLRLWQDDQH